MHKLGEENHNKSFSVFSPLIALCHGLDLLEKEVFSMRFERYTYL